MLLLKRWRAEGNYFHGTPKFLALPMECRLAMIDLDVAETTGNANKVMKALCEWAAAIPEVIN